MATGRIPSTEGGIQPTTVDAKGDLIVGAAADTPARLAVGNNGETLLADSSTTTGLRWSADWNTGKNKIINGDFGIWQRGTSFSTGASAHVYTADRWLSYFYGTNTSTVSQQTFTPGTAPVAGYEGQFFGRFSSTSTANFISYRVEDVRTLANQVSTLSFWIKSNSNQTITIEVNQNFGSGGSATANALNTTQAITQSWTRYSFTFTPASLSGKTIGTSSYVVISISGAINNAIDLWGVQLEAGSVATPFTTATGTLQGELAACQRYYFRTTAGNAYGRISNVWPANSTTQVYPQINHPVTMRVAPTAVDYANVAVGDGVNLVVPSSITITAANTNVTALQCDATGLTQYRPYGILGNNNTAGYVGLSAEL